MINILVTLEVKSFKLLTAFETKAVQIMSVYGGRLISAFETVRNADDSGQEVHLLEFPSLTAFDEYRLNPQLLASAELRNEAIASTEVVISSEQKDYS
jgi:uncharacterized protein (DUF1330 family)